MDADGSLVGEGGCQPDSGVVERPDLVPRQSKHSGDVTVVSDGDAEQRPVAADMPQARRSAVFGVREDVLDQGGSAVMATRPTSVARPGAIGWLRSYSSSAAGPPAEATTWYGPSAAT